MTKRPNTEKLGRTYEKLEDKVVRLGDVTFRIQRSIVTEKRLVTQVISVS